MSFDQKYLKIFVILSSILIFFLSFYFKEFLYAGSQSDFNTFVFKNIKIFKDDFIYAIYNYGKLGDANWPLTYIFHAYINPLSNKPEGYLISTTTIGFLTFTIFAESLKNRNLSNVDSYALASLILLLPWFNGRAHWGTSANLGWFFFSIAIYFFTKFENNINLNKIRKLYLIFLICFFSALALYARLSLSFFCIFFSLIIFISEKKIKIKIILFFFYLFLSIPGLILVYIWGDIFDYRNGTINFEHHNYKNILKNIPIIFNYFFFYFWPIFLIHFNVKKLKLYFKDNYKIFFSSVFLFIYLFLNNYFDYLSNYTYGGGVILKFGYIIGDKSNFLFLISSFLGAIFIFDFIKESFKNNLLLFFTIFIIYGFPMFLYQDYFEPLIFFLFYSGLIKSKKFLTVKKKYILVLLIYFFYFTIYNFSTVIYKLYI